MRIVSLLLLFSTASLQAFFVEGNVGYFRPSERTVREVYGSSWVNYGITGEYQPSPNPLALFASLNLLQRFGFSQGISESTSIVIVPITCGAKWIQPLSHSLSLVAGVAPRYYVALINNRSEFVKKHDTLHGLGLLGLLGLRYRPTCRFSFDLSVGYTRCPLSTSQSDPDVEAHSVQLGGVEVTGGLGWHF